MVGCRGALGFFTRIPVGFDAEAWAAFQRTPLAFPLAGYVVGALLAPVFLLPLPDVTVATAFVAWVYLLTGVNHADGVADLGDAMAVHGDRAARLDAMKDVSVGAGGVLALLLVVMGQGLAGLELASLDAGAFPIVIAAEVGAKTGIVALAALHPATHEGLASGFTSHARARSLALPLALAVPAGALSLSGSAAAALTGAVGTALLIGCWSRRRLGGVSGDVLGATNDLARVVALHAGVIAWTLS